MGAIATPPPPKRRRTNKSTAIPSWERTRQFSIDKPRPSALPVIRQDGAVTRPPTAPPKLTIRARKKPAQPAPQPPSDEPEEREPGNKSRQSLKRWAKRENDLQTLKERVAHLASKIVAAPEQNVNSLAELRKMAQQNVGKCAALVILTESQLYKDIVPAYRIRPITEKEAETKVSKDVLKLRTYEQTLLKSFQTFVTSCISVTRWRTGGGVETDASRNMAKVRRAACKALAEILRALPHFNEAEVVANAVCSLVVDREQSVRKECANALGAVLGEAHRASGGTLDICVLVARKLADVVGGKVNVVPEEVLEPLVEIQFGRFARLPLSSDKPKNLPKKKKRFIKKRRRKPQGEEEVDETELERDLREGDAEATPQELYNARKMLLDAVCKAYFNVIKAAATTVGEGEADGGKRRKKPPAALAPALKGLLRVATYIRTGVIEAILAALTPLLEKGRLPLAVRFRCLSAAYAVLGVHARTKQADPDSFTGDARAMDVTLYKALGCLYGPDMPTRDVEEVTFDAVEAVLACFSFRDVPFVRCTALARRLCLIATSFAPTHACSIALLRVAQQILPASLVSPIYPQTTNGGGEGDLGMDMGFIQAFDMDADDPEIASAERSAAWELSCLIKHFHPAVREMAQQCASGYCGPRIPKTTENVMLTVRGYSSSEGGFNPPPKVNPPGPVKRKVRRVGVNSVVEEVMGSKDEGEEFLNGDEELPNRCFVAAWNSTRELGSKVDGA